MRPTLFKQTVGNAIERKTKRMTEAHGVAHWPEAKNGLKLSGDMIAAEP